MLPLEMVYSFDPVPPAPPEQELAEEAGADLSNAQGSTSDRCPPSPSLTLPVI